IRWTVPAYPLAGLSHSRLISTQDLRATAFRANIIQRLYPNDGIRSNDDEVPTFEDPELHNGHDFASRPLSCGPTQCDALQPRNCIAQWEQYHEVVGPLFGRLGADGCRLRCQ